jgi:hypothetical protein
MTVMSSLLTSKVDLMSSHLLTKRTKQEMVVEPPTMPSLFACARTAGTKAYVFSPIALYEQSLFVTNFVLYKESSYKLFNQCCGSVSGIRDEHPGSYFRELRNNFWGLKILKFFDADPV